MYRKLLVSVVTLGLVAGLLAGCSAAKDENTGSLHTQPPGAQTENTPDLAVKEDEKDAETGKPGKDKEHGETAGGTAQTVTHSDAKQDVLYRADFDVPDVRGTGYTNLIDFYNTYPDGRDGGTFANAGLMVHYRDDMDKDLSAADSLAFRTYRGIGLGSSMKDVFAAYGIETAQPPFPEVMGIGDSQHTVTSFVEYNTKIQSGACVGIRFYFDQNDTVMWIEYNAIYLKYAGNISASSLKPLAD